MLGYSFEKFSFKFISINEENFGLFLSYKIESILSDEEDVGFSLNALFPKFGSIKKLKLNILEEKWKYLNRKEKGKNEILKSLGFKVDNKESFSKVIFNKICNNYIYCLNANDFGDYLFNVCVELQTQSGNVRKTTIALKYKPDSGEVDLITIT